MCVVGVKKKIALIKARQLPDKNSLSQAVGKGKKRRKLLSQVTHMGRFGQPFE